MLLDKGGRVSGRVIADLVKHSFAFLFALLGTNPF